MVFSFDHLWFPALFVTLFGAWVLVRGAKVKFRHALSITLVKASLPILWFGYFFHRGWLMLDDRTYFEASRALLWKGNSPFLIFFMPDGLQALRSAAGSEHFLYYWWNLLAMSIFGPFYSSPVFLNVATTFISAALLFRLARSSGCTDQYSRWLCVFFLFHWEVLSWSSFLNLKDSLVLMLTLAAFFFGMQFVWTKKVRYAILLVATLLLFTTIRLYIPLLFLSAFVLWGALAVKGWRKVPWILVVAIGLWIAFPERGLQRFDEEEKYNLIHGAIRWLLAPEPWTEAAQGSAPFFLVSDWLHWVFAIPAIAGGLSLFRKNPGYRFPVIYLLVVTIFYGLLKEYSGERQRFQVCWVYAWAQFDFLWFLLSGAFQRTSAAQETALYARASPP